MTEATPPVAWVVDSQNQRTRATPSGAIEEGYDVNFHTGQGHYGTVFIPNSRYTPQNVADAVTVQALKLDTVGSLSMGQVP